MTTGEQNLLQPLRPARTLTDVVVERVATEIRSGRLAPGTQLPTEAALMAAMGVSRTVVREAVAALRADGMVLTRQGLGAFVASDASRAAFRIPSQRATDDIAEVLRVMELRLAVEVEAAALAAEHASAEQVATIKMALGAIDRAIAAGDGAVQEDFAFHHAVANATGNPHFASFLAFLGGHVIPRQIIRNSRASPMSNRAYLDKIQTDHVAIADAIASKLPNAARNAMRAHLTKSIDRYRQIALQPADQS